MTVEQAETQLRVVVPTEEEESACQLLEYLNIKLLVHFVAEYFKFIE
jgi:hypothetical protein